MAEDKLLSHAAFAILLALGGKFQLDYNIVRHGYGIGRQVEEDSQGRIRMNAGTLYGTLKKLAEAGLIEDVPFLEENSRRISYRLTKKGWDRLVDELTYYNEIAKIAKERKVIPADKIV